MKDRLVIACTVFTIGLAGIFAGCSSSNDKQEAQGSLAIRLDATAAYDESLSNLRAAVITIAGIEARTAEGSWVPVDTGLPAYVDLVAIMSTGNAATLPSDLLPEGDYDAVAVRISAVVLTLQDDTTTAITPPGGGWTVLNPANFRVVAGESTVVTMRMNLLSSFKFYDGEFVFEPELEVLGVERN